MKLFLDISDIMTTFITPQFGGYNDPAVYFQPAGFVATTGFFYSVDAPAGLGASSDLGPLVAASLIFILARPRRPPSSSSGKRQLKKHMLNIKCKLTNVE